MKIQRLYITLNIFVIAIAVVMGDMFTSIAKLEPLIETEDQLLNNIRQYVNHEKRRINDIERLIAYIQTERVDPSSVDSSSNDVDSVDLGNPIQSFLLLRRLRRQWYLMKHYVRSADNQNNYLQKMKQYEKSLDQYPSEEDYEGSANALLRLQETYGLETALMADGRLLGEQRSSRLLADDCYDIGKLAKGMKGTRFIEWMQEAKRRRKAQPNTNNEIIVLEQLAEGFFQQGKYKKALENIDDILKLDSRNAFSAQWKSFYERELKLHLMNDSASANEDARYRALCRGDKKVYGKAKNPRKLLCRYTHYNRPRLFIRPAKEEILFSEPRIVFYHDIVTDREMEMIKQRALPDMKRSEVDYQGKSNTRISSIAWLDIFNRDDPLGKLLPRVEDYTGLSTKVRHTELLQVANYGLGGFYNYHYDDETDGVSDGLQGMGKRIATLLFYFSDVDAGGATVFTKAGVRVAPLKGGAVLWYNYLKNGDRDLLTRHAGCPVLMGTKWASNLWIREYGQVFRRRCGLSQDDKY